MLKYKKGMSESIMKIIAFLVIFSFLTILAYLIFDSFITELTISGYYNTELIQTTGENFYNSIKIFDYMNIRGVLVLIKALTF